MTASIEELDAWLESQAKAWEKMALEQAFRTSSPQYYRALKGLDKQEFFILSSKEFFADSPLTLWLKEHEHEYETSGWTGGGLFVKKGCGLSMESVLDSALRRLL